MSSITGAPSTVNGLILKEKYQSVRPSGTSIEKRKRKDMSMDSKIVVFPSPFINILSSQRYRDTDTRYFQILLKPQSDEVGWHSNLTVWICRRRNQNNCRTYHTKQAIGPRQVSSCNVNIFHQLFLSMCVQVTIGRISFSPCCACEDKLNNLIAHRTEWI